MHIIPAFKTVFSFILINVAAKVAIINLYTEEINNGRILELSSNLL